MPPNPLEWKEEFCNRFCASLHNFSDECDEFNKNATPEKVIPFIENLLLEQKKETIKECQKIVGTHGEDEDLSYCDTGEDMDRACRANCVRMAIKRLNLLKPQP